MLLQPVVRYMILCDGCFADPPGSRQYTVVNLLTNVHAHADVPFPYVYPKLCVFLALTAGRGRVRGHISCVFEDSGQVLFRTPDRDLVFGTDPLEVRPFLFSILECIFHLPGLYTVQFNCEGVVLAECPLRVR